jgi:hypothetical protein
MTSDILKLRDAVTRDTEGRLLGDSLKQRAGEIRVALNESGEYRLSTRGGTIVIRSAKKSA